MVPSLPSWVDINVQRFLICSIKVLLLIIYIFNLSHLFVIWTWRIVETMWLMGQGIHVHAACLGSNLAVLPLIRASHVMLDIPLRSYKMHCKSVIFFPQAHSRCDVLDGVWASWVWHLLPLGHLIIILKRPHVRFGLVLNYCSPSLSKTTTFFNSYFLPSYGLPECLPT